MEYYKLTLYNLKKGQADIIKNGLNDPSKKVVVEIEKQEHGEYLGNPLRETS